MKTILHGAILKTHDLKYSILAKKIDDTFSLIETGKQKVGCSQQGYTWQVFRVLSPIVVQWQCDQIGRYLKVLSDKFSSKITKI